MLIGFLTAYQFYIRRPDLPRKLAENQQILYQFLLNKWYIDEIYDFLFVKPAMWLGTFLVEEGRRQSDRRCPERAGHGNCAVLYAPRRAGSVGIHLYLCLRDGAGHPGAGHLDDLSGGN